MALKLLLGTVLERNEPLKTFVLCSILKPSLLIIYIKNIKQVEGCLLCRRPAKGPEIWQNKSLLAVSPAGLVAFL